MQCETISEEKWKCLHTIEELDAALRKKILNHFIDTCSKSDASALTDEEIQNEVNAVRYDK